MLNPDSYKQLAGRVFVSADLANAQREQLLACFPDNIFVEAMPNGYCSRWCCKHLPWFKVTTEAGVFVIGWRKRVIHLEWTGVPNSKLAEELFPNEDVTKGERYIHAWSYDQAEGYIATIIANKEEAKI